MHLQAGAETILMNRHTLSKTYLGEEFSFTKKDINLKPGVLMESMYSRRAVNICFLYKCRRMDIKVAIKTKACTPFFLSGPKFSFVFHKYTSITQSWLDAIITARSEQKSVTSSNCLEYFNVHESIFKTRNFFSKSVISTSRLDSILVNLIQAEKKNPVQIRIKVLTRSKLSKTKSKTIIDLKWTSVLSLSREISQKTISLPGRLRSVTFEALNFFQNYTINVHWIPQLISRNFYQSNNEGFCHKDIMTTTKHTYCLNYTSVQSSYLFFWNFTKYLHCYYVPSPHSILDHEHWAAVGFTIPKNNKCPKRESKSKVIKSWTEASEMCKSIGGYLPLIRNQDELDEIIAFLKLSEDMPPVEGLYIGLRDGFKTQVTHEENFN